MYFVFNLISESQCHSLSQLGSRQSARLRIKAPRQNNVLNTRNTKHRQTRAHNQTALRLRVIKAVNTHPVITFCFTHEPCAPWYRYGFIVLAILARFVIDFRLHL